MTELKPRMPGVVRVLGAVGALLGVAAGVVQLAAGSSIPDWTGNKNDTSGLGLATIMLSIVAGIALWQLARVRRLSFRVAYALMGIAAVVICFTTVGRLWYVPGPLLLLAFVLSLISKPAGGRG